MIVAYHSFRQRLITFCASKSLLPPLGSALCLLPSLALPAFADTATEEDRKLAKKAASVQPVLPTSVVAPLTSQPTPPAASNLHLDWGMFNAAGGSAAGFGAIGKTGQVRWSEDWSALRTMSVAEKKKDWFNRLKYIPLTDKGDIWLTLSGEERLRYIFENQPVMGTAGVTNASRVLLRNQYGADLHLGEHVRAYAEFLYAVAGGSNTYGYQTGVQRERLDLQQGILEVKGHALGAQMGVIGGRQLFLDAPIQMQSARDLTNVQLSWDGARGYAIWKHFRMDGFYFMQTNKQPIDVFADGTNYSARLYGLYTSTALPSFSFMKKNSQLFADVYFLGYLYNGAGAAIPTAAVGKTQAGSSRRDNIGMRVWGNVGPFSVSLNGVFQGGQFRQAKSDNTRPVRAFAVNGTVMYSMPNLPAKPSVGLQADVFSGGNYNKTSGAVGTFSTPYVPLPYYNDVSLTLTSENLVGVGPVANFMILKNLGLKAHIPVFWRESTDDAVYNPNNKIFAARGGLHGGFIGTIPQTQLTWNFAPHWTWTHDIAGIVLSNSMRQNGAKNGAFYMQSLEFKF